MNQPASDHTTQTSVGDDKPCSPCCESDQTHPISFAGRILSVPGICAILLVRAYQWTISPMLGRTCRFHPSCSQYFILAVKKHGLLTALWKGTLRICRCHPWNPGGYDPP